MNAMDRESASRPTFGLLTRAAAVLALAFVAVEAARSQPVEYAITARVDTTNAEVREVLATWINYLWSVPDSAYDNPHWNSHEKQLYGHRDFDFASYWISHQIPSDVLLASYPPRILSIDKVDDHYEIRTMFYGENLPAEMSGSNPVTILRVAATREDGGWKLANMLPFVTRNWIEHRVGPIRYRMPPTYRFNEMVAHRAHAFVDSVASMLGVEVEPFSFYLASSIDELGSLLGHDFFFVGVTTGLTLSDNRIVMSSKRSEHYPHELVHVVAGTVPNGMINEGLATWIGGSGDQSFVEGLRELRRCLEADDSVSIEGIWRREWGWHCNAYYMTGAAIVDLVYKRGGMSAVRQLMKAPTEEGPFFDVVADALGVRRDDLGRYVLDAIRAGMR